MTIAPPAANVWDDTKVTGDALARLRLTNSDVDAARVADAAAAACELLDHELDREIALDAAAVAALHDAAVQVTIVIYQRSDLRPDGTPVGFDPTHDVLAQVRTQALPWKARWGLA